MHKNLYLLSFLLFISSLLYAQPSEEELYAKAEKYENAKSWNELAGFYLEKDDTVKLRTSAQKAYELAKIEHNNKEEGGALYYIACHELAINRKPTENYKTHLFEAAELLKPFSLTDYHTNCYHAISQIYNKSGKHDEALKYLYQAVNKARPEYQKMASLYCDISYAHLYNGSFDSVRHYSDIAIKIATERKDTLPLTVTYSICGILYRRENNFAKSLDYYLKAAELYRSLGEWTRLATAWCNMAVLYTDWEKYDQALEFAQEAIEVVKSYNLSDWDLGRALLVQGVPLVQLGHVREAVFCYQRSLPLIETSYHRRSCLFGLTKSYYELGMRDSSMYYMNQLEEEFEKSGANKTDSYYVFKAYMAYKDGNYDDAIRSYERSLDIRKNKSGGAILRDDVSLYLRLSDSYVNGPKNFEKALYYKQIAFNLQDSINSREHNEALSSYYAQYQTAEKELQINRLEMERQKSAYIALLVLIGCGLLIVTLILLLLNNRMKRLKKEKEASDLMQRVKDKENDFLVFQQETEKRLTRKYIDGLETERERLARELHDDVCNSLLTLEMKVLAKRNEPNSSADPEIYTLGKIREHVRHISHELMPPVFQYATIDEMLEDLILHLALPKKTKASYVSTPNVNWDQIPPEIGFELYRITQETLNNTIKYAKASHISVHLKIDREQLQLIIEDDGCGFDVEQKNKGIGLRTIANRMQSVNGTIQINSEINKGTRIIASIALHTYKALEQ